jgi:hypothetical protein
MKKKLIRTVELTEKLAKTLFAQEFGISASCLKADVVNERTQIFKATFGRFEVTISNDWLSENGLIQMFVSTHTGQAISLYYDPKTLEEDFAAHDEELAEIRADYCADCELRAKAEAEENERRREDVEMQYYEDNDCFPRPTGYFGTETDAHFYER